MDITAEEFVDRLVSEEAYDDPCDKGKISDLEQQLPPWFDEKLCKVGQKFFLHNLFGEILALMTGFISVLAVPTTLSVMVHTRNSTSSRAAYSRYMATFLHTMAWQYHDLKPGSLSWKSLQYVRARHLRVDKNAKTCGVGSISQRDLALTQFGMCGFTFLKPDFFNIQSCDDDSWEGFNHFWRTLCYMIGLKDKYNICSGTADDTREICRLILKRVIAPLLENPPEPFEHVANVILDGFWSSFPLSEPKGIMYLTRYVADVPGYVLTEGDLIEFRRKIKYGELKQDGKPYHLAQWPTPNQRSDFNPEDFTQLSRVPEYRKLYFFDRIKLQTVLICTQLYSTTIFRSLLNGLIKFLLCLSTYLPILAIMQYGITKPSVGMFSETKPDRTVLKSNAEISKMYSEPPWHSNLIDFLRKTRNA